MASSRQKPSQKPCLSCVLVQSFDLRGLYRSSIENNQSNSALSWFYRMPSFARLRLLLMKINKRPEVDCSTYSASCNFNRSSLLFSAYLSSLHIESFLSQTRTIRLDEHSRLSDSFRRSAAWPEHLHTAPSSRQTIHQTRSSTSSLHRRTTPPLRVHA